MTRKHAFVFALAGALCACGGTQSSGTQQSEPDETDGGQSQDPQGNGSSAAQSGGVPDFYLDSLDGEEFHMAEHVGTDVLLLNFWATWCEPCRVEMPHLDRLQQSYGAQGLRVLCISMDGPESASDVRGRISRYDFAFTVLLDQESEVTRIYNPRRAAPFNILVNRDGDIVWTHEGYSPGDETELEEQIRLALGLAAESAGQ